MEQKRPQSFEEAIQALNQAMASQGSEIKDLLKADFANLKAAVEDIKQTATPYVDKAREAAGSRLNSFDQQVRKNPYLAIGGVALAAVAIGYLFGRSQTPQTSDYSDVSVGDDQSGDA